MGLWDGLSALILTGALGISGCAASASRVFGGNDLSFGVVTRKEVEPGDSCVRIYRLVLSDGKETHIGKIPILCENDEKRIVYFKKGENESKAYITDRKRFDELKIGDRIYYGDDDVKMTEPGRQRRLTLEEFNNLLGK
jgi:hypothetical protein